MSPQTDLPQPPTGGRLKTIRGAAIIGNEQKTAHNDRRRNVAFRRGHMPGDVRIGYVSLSVGANSHHMVGGETGRHVEHLAVINERGNCLCCGTIVETEVDDEQLSLFGQVRCERYSF